MLWQNLQFLTAWIKTQTGNLELKKKQHAKGLVNNSICQKDLKLAKRIKTNLPGTGRQRKFLRELGI